MGQFNQDKVLDAGSSWDRGSPRPQRLKNENSVEQLVSSPPAPKGTRPPSRNYERFESPFPRKQMRAAISRAFKREVIQMKDSRAQKPPLGLLLTALIVLTIPVLETKALAQSPTWTLTGNLNAGRGGHTATLLTNGKVLVAGGGGFPCTGNFCYATVNGSAELYDPATGTWTMTGSLNRRRTQHSATLLQNGKVLVLGGYDYGYPHWSFSYINSVELYDPSTGSWRATAGPVSNYIANAATLLKTGKVLAVFQKESPSNVLIAELYDPATETWSSTNAPTAFGMLRSSSNGRIISVSPAGYESFDPSNGQWTRLGGFNVIHLVSTATVLNNDRVLITGESRSSTKLAEIFDTATGTSSPTGNPRTSGGGQATLLSNGDVLVSGGATCSDVECHSLDNAEVYNQASGTWSLISPLQKTRYRHSATLLTDGKVLLAGGNEGDIYDFPRFLTITELYDPSASSLGSPMADARSFVRQQYRDFLHREPDAAGLAFWTDNITRCSDAARRPESQTEAECEEKQKVNTSAAFFLSPEFQYTGYFVYRLYKGSLIKNGGGRAPTHEEFLRDVPQVAQGIIQDQKLSAATIEANKKKFAQEFTQRVEFRSLYDPLSNWDYVERLFQTSGVSVSAAEKQVLVQGLDNQTETRASVLQKVVDGTVVLAEGNQQFSTPYGRAFYQKEFNSAFVLMEYFGYLQRDPDDAGYQHWLDKLNFYGNYEAAEMVQSFISSPEYQARFGQP